MTTRDEEFARLRSAALQNASSILAARRRAEQRQEAYLAEAQRLSQTGSFGWKPSTGEIIWSEETFRIFQYDRSIEPTVARVLERVHPEDAARVKETIERASRDGAAFEHEYRLLMPDGFVKHVHVVARASSDASGGLEFVGAVMDITARRHGEDALRRSESYLAQAQKLTHTGSWAWDAATREAVHLSEQWYRIYGLDPEAGPPTWKALIQRVHPEDRTKWEEAIHRATVEKLDYELEFRVLLPGGTIRYVHSVGHPVWNASGDVLQFVGSSTDITEGKRAAEALREREARIRRLVESNIIGVFFWDVGGRITEANDAFLRTVGYSRQDLQAGHVSWSAMTPPEYRGADENAIEELMRSGTHPPYEKEYVRKDGSRVVVLLGGAFIEGSREQGVSFVLDLTERKKAEAELARSEAVLREQASLLDLTHDTVFVRDMNDVITYWNRGAEELYGWSAEQAVGKTTHQLLQTSFPEPLAQIKAELLRTGRWEGELAHTKRDATQVVVASRWALQRDERGNAVALLETNNDITARKRSEAELQHTTALLGELFEGGPDALVLMDLEARVLRINREFAALFGYTAEEAAGRLIVDLIVPEDELENSRAGLARAQTGERFVDERERRRKDGTRIHVSIKRALIVVGGKPIGYYGIYRDITERMRAEEALRLSEERYALAMLAAEDAHWDWNVRTDEYYLSPRTLDLFGLPPGTVFTSREDYLARTPLVREDLEKWQRAMAELFAGTGSRLSMEVRAIVRGEIRWLQHIGVCVRDASGRPVRWCGTARDITERKRTEEALQRSEAYLAEAQKLSRTGSWAWNARTEQITHWSEEQYRMLGFDPQGGVPSDQAILERIHPGDQARYIENLKCAIRERKDLETHYRVCLPGSAVKYVHVVGHPVFSASGELVEYVGSSMDVTERKLAEDEQRAREREREEMQKQLQQAAKMEAIGRLAGGIAHDFNNILGAILGYGELAQKNLEGRAVRRHVDQVMQAGARGKGLVERILAFSRSGLGERVPVHVQAVVEEALEILAASLAAGVRLEQRLEAGDAAVVGDATQLHQVAMNLCTNALQAMEHGGVLTVVLDRAAVSERRALSHGTLAPGSYVRLSVSDTGSGIPPAVVERMFDPFFTTKGVGEGTGLGLSLVHGIVADFGGAIDVQTQAGAGTTFTVWLPASGETARILAEPAGELPQGNGETVMIVDDQASLVSLAEETLAALGYDPAGFRSSVAALQAFRAEPQRYDLVLTDETMPDMSGVDLVREMRRVRPELPIVLMSGYSGAQLTERAHAAGVAEVLRKPLVRRDIAHALGRALRPS